MKPCKACGKEFPESEMIFSADGMVCRSCEVDLDSGGLDSGAMSPPVLTGLIGGVIPFFISMAEVNTTTVNGQSTTEYFDIVAVVGGGLALGAGLFALKGALQASKHASRWGTPAAVAALGVYQLLRGFGKA